jgi:hypothetical protein
MTPNVSTASESRREIIYPVGTESEGTPASAVSWGAIFAGAAAAAALSLILLFLGTGLGLSAISPWAQEGASAKSLGIGTAVWVTFMQLAAAALGGYIAGRLRTKWVQLHTDEVRFRDTAHGFLAWCVATLLTAWLVSSSVTSIIAGGAKAAASVAGGAASAATTGVASEATQGGDTGPTGYLMDSLFRKDAKAKASSAQDPAAATAEAGRIFKNALAAGKLPPEDSRYLGQVVAQRTGVSQQEAEKRVNETFAKLQQAEASAKEAADKARKTSAAAALWMFISLLIGAFTASLCATYGGRLRDE